MESSSDDEFLILYNKKKAQLLQIDLRTRVEHFFRIENEEKRVIRDINIYNQFLCVLYDKNEVIVYNMQNKSRIFKSEFRDATATVSRLFYISEFDDEVNDEEENRFKDDEIIGDN